MFNKKPSGQDAHAVRNLADIASLSGGRHHEPEPSLVHAGRLSCGSKRRKTAYLPAWVPLSHSVLSAA